MNIGFDGKRAANNLTGLGNYSRSLITQLANRFHQNQYFVYSQKVKEKPQISSFFKTDRIHLKLASSNAFKILWRSFGIKKQLNQDNIELFHGLSYEIPIGLKNIGIKSVVTIHDLIYLRYPSHYKWIDRCIYDFKSKYACKNSDRIVAISERTKQDIIELYKINEDKIEVIYQTCDDSFKKLQSSELRESLRGKYNLPEKYILNVGTIEARKNLLLIVKAMKDINPDYKLVVVGKQQSYARLVLEEIDTLNLKERVIFLQDLPFADLPLIYQMATAFVYPSFYEGFGIPILEALYSEVPVIAATGSCLEEAGGPGSIYINPEDPTALAVQVNKVIDDGSLRKKMISAGKAYVVKFDDQILAKQMMDCYLRTLSNNFVSC